MGGYVQERWGSRVNNLDSDLFFRQIIDSHVIDRMLAEPPPLGPEPAVLQDVQGYVEGYNRYLSDVGGPSGVPDPRCQGQPWVASSPWTMCTGASTSSSCWPATTS